MVMELPGRPSRPIEPLKAKDPSSVRKWWHKILREEGRYACYALFLVLPSDKDTIHYLLQYGTELDLITGDDCLVISLGDTQVKRSDGLGRESWGEMVKQHVGKGYSVKMAQFLGIDLDDFPCFVIFEDIRSSKHIAITLKGMGTKEIAEKMRSVFSTIHKALANKQSPIDRVEKVESKERLVKRGQTVANKIGHIAEKTFEKAIEIWVETVIKPTPTK
jgi:hypothetical protein